MSHNSMAIGSARAAEARAEFQAKVQRGETQHSPVRSLSPAEREAYAAELRARDASRVSVPEARQVPRSNTAHLLRPPARYSSPPQLSAEERAEAFAARRASAPTQASEAPTEPAARAPEPAPAGPPSQPPQKPPAIAPAPAPRRQPPRPHTAPVARSRAGRRPGQKAHKPEDFSAAPGGPEDASPRKRPAISAEASAAIRAVDGQLRSGARALRPIEVALTRNIPLPTVTEALEELVRRGHAKRGRQGTYLAVRKGTKR